MIDLDLAAPWESTDAEPGPAAVPAWLVFVTILTLFLGTVAAGAPPTPSGQVLSVETNARDLRFGGAFAYLLSRPDSVSAELTAFSLDGGAVAWRRPVDSRVGPWMVDGQVLAYTKYTGAATGIGQSPVVEVLDSRTGEPRWTSPGQTALAVVAGTVVAYRMIPAPGPLTAPERRLSGLDAATGEVRWEHTTPRGALWASQRAAAQPTGSRLSTSAAGPDRIVELDAAGLARVVDLRTGTVSTPVRVDRPGTTLWVVAEGPLLLIRDGAAGEGLRGYDLATGDLRWQNQARSFLQPCGEYLCGEVGGTVSVLDTAGTVRWKADRGGQSIVVGHRLLAPAGGEYGIPGTRLIDLPSGRVLRSYGRWQVLTPPDAAGATVAVVNEPARLTVGILDVDTGHVLVVAVVSGWIGQPTCVTEGRFVGCTSGARLVVWRLDR